MASYKGYTLQIITSHMTHPSKSALSYLLGTSRVRAANLVNPRWPVPARQFRRCQPGHIGLFTTPTPHNIRSLSISIALRSSSTSSKTVSRLPIPSHALQRPKRRTWPTTFLVLALVSALPIYIFNSHFSPTTSHPNETSLLNSTRFSAFTLTRKIPVSETSSIFILQPIYQAPPATTDPYAEYWARGTWSVELKQPQLQIARHYTPLPVLDVDTVPGELRLLIRKETKGEVSGYLHRLPLGSTIEIRGPKTEYILHDGEATRPAEEEIAEVIFIAGGTGIAPALQVARSLATKPARMSILWAMRHREESAGGLSSSPPSTQSSWLPAFLSPSRSAQAMSETTSGMSESPLVNIIRAFRSTYPSPRLRVDYFADDEQRFIAKADIQRYLCREAAPHTPADGTKLKPKKRKMLIVSGPEGFVNYVLGPPPPGSHGQLGGEEPRLIPHPAGLLGQLDTRGWEVLRL